MTTTSPRSNWDRGSWLLMTTTSPRSNSNWDRGSWLMKPLRHVLNCNQLQPSAYSPGAQLEMGSNSESEKSWITESDLDGGLLRFKNRSWSWMVDILGRDKTQKPIVIVEVTGLNKYANKSTRAIIFHAACRLGDRCVHPGGARWNNVCKHNL